jgi:hypothetical protein
MIKKIKFSDFSQKYTGFNNYAEIVNELKDALINVKTNESIKECEICELFDKECEISQTLEPLHNFYTIRINNIWECDSVLKIL